MPRSNQTKQLLAQSLQELMVTTPLEKISVNDIVDHAGVGRNTFYYHFEDKYDLVNWYFQSGITQFLVERSAYSSWGTLLTALETYFLENKVFYCNALAYNGQNSLQQYMFDYLRSIFEQNARELNPDANAEETRKIGQFFAGAMMGPPKVEKGLFITTAKFSPKAKEYATAQHIILVDGKKLTELMIEYGVGVSTQKAYLIKRIDSDYFSDND